MIVLQRPAWFALQLGPYNIKVRMQAVAAGVAALGGRVVDVPDSDPEAVRTELTRQKISLAFTCGMRDREAPVRGLLEGLEIPFLITDLGYFKRARGPRDGTGYNQLSLAHLCWVPPDPCPGDRFDELKMAVAEPREPRTGRVLLLGQVPGDTQHWLNVEQLSAWLANRAEYYRARGLRVRFRAHPAAPSVALHGLVENRPPDRYVLTDELQEVDLAVTYNSTAGLEAIMAGLPVECMPCAHYAAVADYGRSVGRGQVLDYFHRLAYAQWTIAELSDGTALRYMDRFAHFLPPQPCIHQ
jgi:hypothetical protein